MPTNRTAFGTTPDGRQVEEVLLTSGRIRCRILTYGGVIRTLEVPDRDGNLVDVVLGMDDLQGTMAQDKFFGALVGRFANRIGGAKFQLQGVEYSLAVNDGPNHIHGGLEAFHKKVWTIEELTENSVLLSLVSPDMEEGYPGTFKVQVRYTLREDTLELQYHGETDKATICNLTNHTYFNLSGHNSGPVTDQYIQLMADAYTPTDPRSIPVGEIAPVEGTPMDLRTAQPIGEHIDDSFDQLTWAGGWDHNWVIRGESGTLRPAAKAWSPKTGILLEAATTLPGVQFYSGNYLTDCPQGKGGAPYGNRWGFCLETQIFPDAPNHPNFPSAVFTPERPYDSTTTYRFGILPA